MLRRNVRHSSVRAQSLQALKWHRISCKSQRLCLRQFRQEQTHQLRRLQSPNFWRKLRMAGLRAADLTLTNTQERVWIKVEFQRPESIQVSTLAASSTSTQYQDSMQATKPPPVTHKERIHSISQARLIFRAVYFIHSPHSISRNRPLFSRKYCLSVQWAIKSETSRPWTIQIWMSDRASNREQAMDWTTMQVANHRPQLALALDIRLTVASWLKAEVVILLVQPHQATCLTSPKSERWRRKLPQRCPCPWHKIWLTYRYPIIIALLTLMRSNLEALLRHSYR